MSIKSKNIIDDDDELEKDFLRFLEEDTKKFKKMKKNTNTSYSKPKMNFMDNNNYEFPKEEYYYERKTDEENAPYGTQWINEEQKDDIYDEITKKREQTFKKLKAIKLPEQRSKEWFDMRNGKITASDGGSVVGVNKYSKEFNVILKKIVTLPFEPSEPCYHGTKLEEIATMIYAYRMNVQVDEFGLMGHPSYSFLGASPDGICSPYKLDGKTKSKYVGRMLEIKCPMYRKIKTSGEIYDNICPAYYWVQVQLQLECCDLDECDFWQCDLGEYSSREEFVNDTDPNEPFRSKSFGLEKGCLIQLIPKKSAGDLDKKHDEIIYGQTKFLYPPKIEMTPYECDEWVASTLSKLSHCKFDKFTKTCKIDEKNNVTFDPQEYVLHRVIYWKLKKSHNVTINRDRKWFKDNVGKFRDTWDIIAFLRKNPEQKTLFVDYISSIKRKYRLDDRGLNKDKYNNLIMSACRKLYHTSHPNYKSVLKSIEREIEKNNKYADELEQLHIELNKKEEEESKKEQELFSGFSFIG